MIYYYSSVTYAKKVRFYPSVNVVLHFTSTEYKIFSNFGVSEHCRKYA